MEISKQQPPGIETMPVVWIYTSTMEGKDSLKALGLGLEEEGIPCRIKEIEENSAHLLSIQASKASSLGVGIGLVESTHEAILHHRDLPDSELLLEVKDETFNMDSLRKLGTNSARFVKGTPLVPLASEETEDREGAGPQYESLPADSQYTVINIEILTRIVIEVLRTFNFEKVRS